MAVVDVIRPLYVRTDGDGVAVPSGTLASVTADDSDAAYIRFLEISTDPWSLRMEPHSPGTGYERHRLRGRIRTRTDVDTGEEDIDVGRGTTAFIDYGTVPVSDSFTELSTPWFQDASFGLATGGPLTDLNLGGGYFHADGSGTEIRTSECYIDIDTRLQPQYSPEVRDNAGVDQSGGTVTDTNQPDLYFGTVAYDGLPALNWSLVVTGPDGEVLNTSGTGTPPETVAVGTGLDDGAYTADFTVRSIIRGADAFEHAQSLSFTVNNTVPPPSPPLLEVTAESGGYRVSWTYPGGQTWDNDYAVAEVWRDDCFGSQRIATVPDGLNGSYLDLAIPQLDPQPVPGPDCKVSSDSCPITYRVRYLGYVSTLVELPSTIPSDLILGWPDTAASIPSGWSRVTALDGFFPRGASGTGAPTITGGSTVHKHTTNAHNHAIGSHSHSLGGNTGSNGSSTTSARFNGASQTQASQPHYHSRPGSTGTRSGQNSGGTAPEVTVTSNDPLAREVIWIESDGAQAAYPAGILGWATESVSGWTSDASSSGRFLQGAAAAGNGGAQTGRATHPHTVNDHAHTGFSHNHSLGNTGLSQPVSSVEAGFGSSTPKWLARHTHPMTVDSASTGNLNTAGGGSTSSFAHEPPHRRLRVLRNTGGGTQTRIIGLYLGDLASLDPLLTVCDGGGGTPDMRTYFCRDIGSSSVNSTGGSSSHQHSTPSHSHSMPSHSHDTDVQTSNTSSFFAPSFGDLGDSPTTGHTHTSGSTSSATPSIGSRSPGNTSISSHIPPYHEAHFVRLDGTISGGPLPVPELKVSDFSSATVPSATFSDGLDRLATLTEIMEVATDRVHDFPRLVADSTPLDGGRHTVSTSLPGEDVSLSIAVEGLPDIDRLESILSETLVYWSPLGGQAGWFAPAGWRVEAPAPGVKLLQVTMTRQPWPATDDPEVYL